MYIIIFIIKQRMGGENYTHSQSSLICLQSGHTSIPLIRIEASRIPWRNSSKLTARFDFAWCNVIYFNQNKLL